MRGVTGSRRDLDGRSRSTVDGGHDVRAAVALAAAGMVWRRLEVDGVDELISRGVYYGAGRSEAAQCNRRRRDRRRRRNSAGKPS